VSTKFFLLCPERLNNHQGHELEPSIRRTVLFAAGLEGGASGIPLVATLREVSCSEIGLQCSADGV
jgi:hypothetical protein